MTGTLLAPLKLFVVASLLLLGLLLAAWIVDWIFVFHVWPDGVGTLQEILAEDLARAGQMGHSRAESPRLAEGMANFLYALVFESTGIHAMGVRFAEASALSIPDTVVRSTYFANFELIHVAMIGTQLFGVRLATLVTATPLLAVVYCVAVADGLAKRAIRRASGGRESANLYHRAKHFQVVLLVTSAAAALLLPMSVDPRYIWLPSALAVVALARLQWGYYKKHF